MSNKHGTVFSKSLFGYTKRDVNEYIRLADESNSERIKEYEARISDLEETLSRERESHQEEIKKLADEKDAADKNAETIKLELSGKLADSEARCTSYLKLADSSALRAEAAETRASELAAEIDIHKNEINDLKAKCAADEKQISELNATIVSLSAYEEKSAKPKLFKLRRPIFFMKIKK